MTTRQKSTIEALVRSIHNLHGAGEVLAVVFPLAPWAGVTQRAGLVVSQQQYGMRAHRFRMYDRHVVYLGRKRVFEAKVIS